MTRSGMRQEAGVSARRWLCVTIMLALGAGVGLAQEMQPPLADPPNPTSQAPRTFEPGFLEAVGRWFERSAEDINTKARNARESAKGALDDVGEKAKAAAAAAKEAAEKFSKLPGARVVEGRELCEMAPNGSADCRAAVESMCKSKGYATGKSLDIRQAEKCPVRSWLAGVARSDCKTETHVTRAVCQ